MVRTLQIKNRFRMFKASQMKLNNQKFTTMVTFLLILSIVFALLALVSTAVYCLPFLGFRGQEIIANFIIGFLIAMVATLAITCILVCFGVIA